MPAQFRVPRPLGVPASRQDHPNLTSRSFSAFSRALRSLSAQLRQLTLPGSSPGAVSHIGLPSAGRIAVVVLPQLKHPAAAAALLQCWRQRRFVLPCWQQVATGVALTLGGPPPPPPPRRLLPRQQQRRQQPQAVLLHGARRARHSVAAISPRRGHPQCPLRARGQVAPAALACSAGASDSSGGSPTGRRSAAIAPGRASAATLQ